jgi:putative peptidoglycan lipid II flippase
MTPNQKHSVFKAAIIISFFTLMSRLAGLYRERIFAATFGKGDLADIYIAAFRVPDLIFNLLILGTLSVAFIPVFTEYRLKNREEANDIANTIFNATFLGMLVICTLLFIFARPITALAFPGFSGQKLEDTVSLTRILLFGSPLIFALSNIFYSVLSSYKRFFLISITPILYNFGIIFGITFLYPNFGLNGVAYGVILGALAHFLVHLAGAIHAGFRFKPVMLFKHPGIKKIVRLFLPRIFGIDITYVSLFIASIIGSTLATGTIAVFNYANNLQAVTLGMFGISFAMAAFPYLSESFADKNEEEFRHILSRTIVNILFFVIPITFLVILLRAQVVRVILGTGEIDWEATILIANTLGILAIAIFSQSLTHLFARSFYARQNTVIPVIASSIVLVLDIVLSYFLGRQYGVYGLAVAFSISSIVNMVLLFVWLRRALGKFDDRYLINAAFKILLAAIVLGAVGFLALRFYSTYFNLDTFVSVLAQGLFAGILGALAFLLTGYFLHLEQVKHFWLIVKKRILG